MAAVPRSSVTLSGVAEAGMGMRLPVNAVRVAERRAPPSSSARDRQTQTNAPLILSPPFAPPLQMMGAGVGTLGALVAATLKSRVAGQGIGPAFSALLFSVVPTTTAAAVLFTLGTGIACEVRGRRDWFNDLLGGAGAGAVMVGVRQRSIQSGLLGALAFGAAGAAAGVVATMQPDGVEPHGLVDKRRLVSTPADFGAAAASAAAAQRRIA